MSQDNPDRFGQTPGGEAGASGEPEAEPLFLEIQRILRTSLTEQGVMQWLRARNRLLGGRRPVDLIREGHVELVSRAARAFADGAYV